LNIEDSYFGRLPNSVGKGKHLFIMGKENDTEKWSFLSSYQKSSFAK